MSDEQKQLKATGRAVAKPPQDRAIRSADVESRAGVYRPRRPRLPAARRVRALLAVFSFAFCLPASADTYTVWGRIQDIGGGSLASRLTWTPTNIVVVGNAGLVGGPPITIIATNGFFTNVFECGDYWVKLSLSNGVAIPRAAFLVAVPCGGGTNHITNLIANAASYVYTNTWGGATAHTNNTSRVGVVLGRGIGTNLADLTLNNPTLTGLVDFDLLDFDSSTERGWVQQQADGLLQVSRDGSSLTNLDASQLLTGTVPTARLGSIPWIKLDELGSGSGTSTGFVAFASDLGPYSTLDGQSLTNLQYSGFSLATRQSITNAAAGQSGDTNNLIRVWNARDYGATGGSIAADSVAVQNAASNLFRFGGVLYFPRGTYWLTNQLTAPNLSTNTQSVAPYPHDLTLMGDGMGSSVLRLYITNGVFWKGYTIPNVREIAFVSYNSEPTATNGAIHSTGIGIGAVLRNAGFFGFTNSTAVLASASDAMVVDNCWFSFNAIGIRLLKYSDGSRVSVYGTRNTIAPVVVGGYAIEGGPEVWNIPVHVVGNYNTYDCIIAGDSRGSIFSGYTESPIRGRVAYGYPPDLFPAETNNPTIQFAKISGYGTAGAAGQAPLAHLIAPVTRLVIEDSYAYGGVSNLTAATQLQLRNNTFTGYAATDNGTSYIPSSSGQDIIVNRGVQYWNYTSTTNQFAGVNSTGFYGNGSGLTNLNASALASGTVPGARLTGTGITNVWRDGGSNSGVQTNLDGGVLTGGRLHTNYATGKWIRETNGIITLGPTNAAATITLDGSTGAATFGTINFGTFLRITNTAQASSYADVGQNGSITNVGPFGAMIWLTNASLANTYTVLQSPSNGINADVINVVSNNVSRFVVDSSGKSTSANGSYYDANLYMLGSGFTAPLGGYLRFGTLTAMSGAGSLLSLANAAYTNVHFSVGGWGPMDVATNQVRVAAALGLHSSTLTATNGYSSRSNVFFLAPTNTVSGSGLLEATGLQTSTVHTRWKASGKRAVQLTEEFIGGDVEDGEIGELGWRLISGGGSVTVPTSETNRAGFYRITSATSNQVSGIALAQNVGTATGVVPASGLEITCEFRPAATNLADIVVGLSSGGRQSPVRVVSSGGFSMNHSGVWLISTNGSNFYLHARSSSGGTQSWADTGVKPQPATWYSLALTFDGATWSASVNGSTPVTATGASLPSFPTVLGPVFQIVSAEAAAKDLDVDFMDLYQPVTR